MTQPTAPATTFAFAPLSDKQREAFEALVKSGAQPKAVNTTQALISRGLVEIDSEGDIAVTPNGWDYAVSQKITSRKSAPLASVEQDEPALPAPVEQPAREPEFPAPLADDETTTEDKAKSTKAAKPEGQTLRIPTQFADHLRDHRNDKGVKSVLTRIDNSDAVDPKDDSVRIPVADSDLPILLAQAKSMVETAKDGSAKRVANGRVRWIERMLAAKA